MKSSRFHSFFCYPRLFYFQRSRYRIDLLDGMKAHIHAPLLKAIAAFILGILLMNHFGIYAYLVFIPAGILGLLSFVTSLHPFRREQFGSIALMLVFLILGAGYFHVRHTADLADDITVLEGKGLVLKGVVSRAPKTTPYGRYTWLDLMSISNNSIGHRVKAPVVAYLPQSDSSAFSIGDTLVVLADLKPATSRNEGYLAYLHKQGIFQAAYVSRTIVKAQESAGLMAQATTLRASLTQRLSQMIPDTTMAAVGAAMFLGDKSHLSQEVKQQFAQAGLSHILAVSGLHVGVIFLGLGFLFHPVNRGKRGPLVKQLLVLAGLMGYMVLTGAGAAVVRAVMMFGLVLVMKLLGQKTHLLTALSFSAWVQILWNPAVVFDVGFQLSYAAVLGIFLVLPWLERQWKGDIPVWLSHLYAGMSVTIAATLFTAPFVIHYFGTFPTWFLLSNVLVSFLGFPLILMGFFSVVAGGILPFGWIHQLLGHCCEVLLNWLVTWAEIMNSLPYSSLTKETLSPVHGWIIGGQILLAFVLFNAPSWIRLMQETGRMRKLQLAG